MSANRRIVVGVDESASSERAVGWAAEEAVARQASLRIVSGYYWAAQSPWEIQYEIQPPESADLRRAAERCLREMAAQVNARFPDVAVGTSACEGDPVRVLLKEAESASLVVVGSRHVHSLSMAIFGSVAAGVASAARCPAVVVRGAAGDPRDLAQVVVGIDGESGTDDLMGFAMEHAARRRTSVHAVTCWRPERIREIVGRRQPEAPERAGSWLSDTVAGWREKYPTVRLSTSVIRDHPVGGLVDASRGQHLLVVGRRHHALGRFGSTTMGVLHHADLPVAVIPVA